MMNKCLTTTLTWKCYWLMPQVAKYFVVRRLTKNKFKKIKWFLKKTTSVNECLLQWNLLLGKEQTKSIFAANLSRCFCSFFKWQRLNHMAHLKNTVLQHYLIIAFLDHVLRSQRLEIDRFIGLVYWYGFYILKKIYSSLPLETEHYTAHCAVTKCLG